MNALLPGLPALAGLMLSSCAHRSTLSERRESTPQEVAALRKVRSFREEVELIPKMVSAGEEMRAADGRPAKVVSFKRRNQAPVVYSQDRKDGAIQVNSVHQCEWKLTRDGYVWTEPVKVGMVVVMKDGITQ